MGVFVGVSIYLTMRTMRASKADVKTSSLFSKLSVAVLAAFIALPIHAAQTVGQAIASYDSLIGNYNLITFGNATIRNYGDTNGGLAIGGNLYISGGVIANTASIGSSTSPTLYVGGGLYQANGSNYSKQNGNLVDSNGIELKLNSGFSSVKSFGSVSAPSSWGNVSASSLSSWVNPTTKKSEFSSISSTLASASVTGSIAVSNNSLRFSSSVTNGVAVFDLNANYLTGNYYNSSYFSSISFDVSSSTTIVINVINGDGKTLFDSSSINFTGSSSTYDSLLWNIVDDTSSSNDSITFGTGEFYGSILASTYTVYNSSNTKLDGQIVADSIVYNNQCGSANELHYTPFEPPSEDLPPTPEPSTYGLIGAAACLAIVGLRRWHKERKAA